MPIDWFTVGAQFINFLILVFGMKRLLYRPILEAISARDIGIAAILREAEEKKNEAAQELARLREEHQQFENQKSDLLKRATERVEERRKQLIASAREEVSRIELQWRDDLARQKDSLRHELTSRVETAVLDVVRDLMHELANRDLEASLLREFVHQLQTFPTNEKNRIIDCLNTSREPIIIRSVFEISMEEKRRIENIVRDQFFPTAEIQFKTAPGLISGVEMTTAGHKISWNVETYLSALEKSFNELITSATRPDADNDK